MFLLLPKNSNNAAESTGVMFNRSKRNSPSPPAKNLLQTDFIVSLSCNSFKNFMPSKAMFSS
jgi:hypothetical protein